ncbi:MAG: archaeosine biosynthesis radical SAM protein RaSEA [Halobacteriota archaeon]
MKKQYGARKRVPRKSGRETSRRRARSNERFAWTGLDLLNSDIVPSLTVVLTTKGCSWARHDGCTMCGYIIDSNPDVQASDIQKQFHEVLAHYGKAFKIVKIFTSGSFLDQGEVPTDVRDAILSDLRGTPKVIVESRPEFVTSEICDDISRINEHIEVAIGLETSNDCIRNNYVNKGFSFRDFVRASEAAHATGFTVKAYLLLKPPFLTEREALEDALQSVRDAAPHADTISLNLCNVQKGTLVEALWKKGLYRSPWLWSAVEVLKRTHETATVICDPVGGGTRRGPHNCGKCDREVVAEIKEFSLSQNSASFTASCTDQMLWEYVLEFEEFSYGAPLVP